MKKNTLMILVVVFGLFSVTTNAFAAQPDPDGETTTFAQPDPDGERVPLAYSPAQPDPDGEEAESYGFAQPVPDGEEDKESGYFAQPDPDGEGRIPFVERIIGAWSSLFERFQ